MKATANQTAENVNEVMDSRIVKLNELKSVKMASLSKGKRPAAKEAKELAAYLLENWDDLVRFTAIVDSEVENRELADIIVNRREELEKAKAEAPKKEKLTKTQKELVEKATKGKKAVTVELQKGAGKSSTAKKAQPKAEEAPKAKKETKATKKAEPKKEDKKEEAKTASAPKSTKKVGDIHKNGKWMWTEYQPGKFDWRTIPTMKQKTGAKPKTETAPKSETKKAEKKQTATKSAKAEKSNAKQTKKGETKKNSPEAPKQLTIAEFIALPVKTAKGNKKPSDAQKEAFKLIMKGYTITADQKFFEKDGDRKSCNIDSVTTMFKRYGIDYIPEGLIKK